VVLAIRWTNNFAAGKSYYDGNMAVNPGVPLCGTRIEAKDIGNELHIHCQTSKCLGPEAGCGTEKPWFVLGEENMTRKSAKSAKRAKSRICQQSRARDAP
jgi:hypothetical protein